MYLTDTPLCKDECLNFQLKNTVHKRQSKTENAKIVAMIEKSKSIYPIKTGFYFNFSREFPVPKMGLKSIMLKKIQYVSDSKCYITKFKFQVKMKSK